MFRMIKQSTATMYSLSVLFKPSEVFTFNLADAFIKSDLQLGNTSSDFILKRQINTGIACNTKFQALFK